MANNGMSDRPLLVACVMLANGRADMVDRAVRAFQAQTYQRRRLLIWNTGTPAEFAQDGGNVCVIDSDKLGAIGDLRNAANAYAPRLWPDADVIAHWDSDDWSHPKRLAEQVDLLNVSGCEVVGYRDSLFWDSRQGAFCGAWRYCGAGPHTVFGASLAYQRTVWEKHPFPSRHTAEDTLWLMRRDVHAMSGLPPHGPRMVCGVHGGNTSTKIETGKAEWRRVPEWDAYCRRVMKLQGEDAK